uniref:hypothetical protein n=1 Tax=Ningiella ruwaisensis TaxID=2364274 RepID=UPI0010A01809|nr:hypothetical protein [Ningiella ruwaisensis]
MDMVTTFNKLMRGFVPDDISSDWLIKNPEGTLRNGSSYCSYKLKKINGKQLLGAYGESRFTNSRFYEIAETGEIEYEWFLQEMCIANDPESEEEMVKHNKDGFDRIEAFGISENV